jgi:hypothetical protein
MKDHCARGVNNENAHAPASIGEHMITAYSADGWRQRCLFSEQADGHEQDGVLHVG